jgi:hypothetical protein
MEPTPKPNSRVKPKEEDIDLEQLFHKTGSVISNFFTSLSRAFSNMGDAFLYFLFFLRRNLLWLLVGTIIGLLYGIYLRTKQGAKYASSMTVRANFNSTRNLYGSIDMFNALVNNDQTNQLAQILKITPEEAASLSYFEVKPVASEMITADLYKDNFLRSVHGEQVKLDTFWINTIKYEDFKKSLTKFDYPLQEITVTSTKPGIFSKIQPGIVNHISANRFLQEAKTASSETNAQVVGLLNHSIQSLDTLSRTYNKRLASMSSEKGSGSTVTMLDGNIALKNPELELYDKLLELKDELKAAKTDAVNYNDIIQVYSSFSTVGHKESFYRQHIVTNALLGLIGTLALIIVISLYKSLVTLEKSYSQRQVSAKS